MSNPTSSAAPGEYSSVRIEGSSVLACRDRDFTSYCELIVESQPRLNGFLENNLSSYRVY